MKRLNLWNWHYSETVTTLGLKGHDHHSMGDIKLHLSSLDEWLLFKLARFSKQNCSCQDHSSNFCNSTTTKASLCYSGRRHNGRWIGRSIQPIHNAFEMNYSHNLKSMGKLKSRVQNFFCSRNCKPKNTAKTGLPYRLMPIL